MHSMRAALVIPALNEAEVIGQTLAQVPPGMFATGAGKHAEARTKSCGGSRKRPVAYALSSFNTLPSRDGNGADFTTSCGLILTVKNPSYLVSTVLR